MSLKSFFSRIGLSGVGPDHSSDYLQGKTDFHSHILPGVDDGVKTMEESLRILSEYEQIGINKVWFTPHIMEDVPNSTEELKKRFCELTNTYQGPITLKLAAENMIDNLFVERLENNDLLPIGDSADKLLVETSYYNPPEGFDEILISIMDKGYRPVIAHPERYRYMEFDDYRRLKDMGIIFQLNILSLIGFYGERARDVALDLVKHGFYDVFGSDIHRFIQTQQMKEIFGSKKYRKHLGKITQSL